MPTTIERYKEVLTRIQKFCQENQQVLGNPSYIPLLDRTINKSTDYHNIYGLIKENGKMVFCYSDMQRGRGEKSIKISLEGLAYALNGFRVDDGTVYGTNLTPQMIIENFLEGVRRDVKEDQIKQSNIDGLVNRRLFLIKQDLESKQL